MSDDTESIERVLRGEIDRFADLIARHRQHVLKIVSGHVPADQAAEVAHDVFVRAYRSLPRFSQQVPFEHWLSRLAVRTCYDFWRARRRADIPVSTLTADQAGWLDRALAGEADARFREQADRRESLEVLDWTLAQLSPVWRVAAGAALGAVVFAGSVVAYTARQPEPVMAVWLEEFDAGPPLIAE